MSLTILNTNIRLQDGLYSLNDLHKAAVKSGVAKDIRPNEWLSLDQTKALAEILITENPCNKPIDAKAGRYGGTYVCRELVYAYAMWISPKFNLHVIRTFDRVVQDEQKRLKASVVDLSMEVSRLVTPASRYVALSVSPKEMLISEAALVLNQKKQAFFTLLASQFRWIYRRGGRWWPRQEAVEKGFVARRRHTYVDDDGVEQHSYQTVLTERGLAAVLSEMVV